MKKAKIQYPFNFATAGFNAAPVQITSLFTGGGINEQSFPFPPGLPILAAHDGELIVENSVAKIKTKVYATVYKGFGLKPEFGDGKAHKVKRGDEIGVTIGGAPFVWAAETVKKHKTANGGEVFSEVHPLMLAGMIGGITYPGVDGVAEYEKNVAALAGSLRNTALIAAGSFAAGVIVAKV